MLSCARLCTRLASLGAAAPAGLCGCFVLVGETVGVELLPSAGVLVPEG